MRTTNREPAAGASRALSVLDLWSLHRETSLAVDTSDRELKIARAAFFGGMFGLVKVLGHMADVDGPDAFISVVERAAAEIREVQRSAPRLRH